jgi:protein-L-isoaspartate(D-aspartate) O-methyltransferase
MNYIEEAFRKVPRANFVEDKLVGQVGIDAPLPIGFGQTNSQPTTVRLMLEWLGPRFGDKVLDVGSGSGWTSALLAYIIGSKGKVYAVEKIPELVKIGRRNCQKLGVKNVSFYKAGNEYGMFKYAPYDRILVSAAAQTLPPELLIQLKPKGKIVIPVRNDILEITKISNEDYETYVHNGFAFVPLV